MSARYTHKYAFRGLIPMTTASSVLGKEKTDTRHMYLGPNGHALTFPVAGGKLLNVVAFVTDPDEWPHANSFTAPAKKADAIEAFKEFGPTVRSIIDMLPDELSKWAVFDTYDNPAPTFVKGRVCITGDAAHAAAPYHGAGAGFAIEDGAVLAWLLSAVNARLIADVDTSKKAYLVEKALQTYDNIRLERAQWLVETSRYIGEMYEWQNTRVGSDHMLSAKEIDWRCRRIWDYDVDGMMRQTRELFDRHLSAVPA
jgi:salicylate hydroxylase